MTIEETLVKLKSDFKEWVTYNLKNKSDITHTHPEATTSKAGLMSATDKVAVNKIGTTDISDIGNGTITGAIDTLNDSVNDCFQSVSDGKTLVATAITDKGIETAPDATFEIMAENISNIITGSKSSFGSGNYSLAMYNSYTGKFVDGYILVDPFTIVDTLFFTQSNGKLTCNKAGTYILFADGAWAEYIATIYNSAGTQKASYYLPNQRWNEITLSVGDYITFTMSGDLPETGHHAEIGIYTKYTSGITGTSSQAGKYSLAMINNYTGSFINGTNVTSFTLVDHLIFSKNKEKLTCNVPGNYVIFADGAWSAYTAYVYKADATLVDSYELGAKRFNEVFLDEGYYIIIQMNSDLSETGHHAIIGIYAAFAGDLDDMITGDIVSGGTVAGNGIRLISKTCDYGPSDSGTAYASGNSVITAISDYYQASRRLYTWWEFSGILVTGRGQILSITNTYRNVQKDDEGIDFHNVADLYLYNVATGAAIRLGSIMANGTTKSFSVPNDNASYAVRIYEATGAGKSYASNTAILTISTLSVSLTDPTATAPRSLVMLNYVNGATAASSALMTGFYFDKNYFINTNNTYQCRVSSTYTFFVAGDIYGNPKLVYLDSNNTILAQFSLSDYKARSFEIGIPSGNRLYVQYTSGSSSANKMILGVYTSTDDPYLALEVTSMEPTEADRGKSTSVSFTADNLVYMNDFAVNVGDTSAIVTSKNDGSFTATFPDTLNVGDYGVVVRNNGVNTTAGSFTVINSWDGSVLGNPEFNDKWKAFSSSTTRYGVVAKDSYIKVFSYDSDIRNSVVNSWGDPDLYVNMESDYDITDDDEVWGTHVYAYVPVDLTDCLTLNVYGEAVQVGPYYCGCSVWVSKTPDTTVQPATFDWTSGGTDKSAPPKYGMVSINVAQLTGIHYICVSKGHWEGYAKITKLFFTMIGEKNAIGGIGRLTHQTGDYNTGLEVINLWNDVNTDFVTNNNGTLTFKRACKITISYHINGYQNNAYCGTTGIIRVNGQTVDGLGGLWSGNHNKSGEKEIEMSVGDTLDYVARLDRYDDDDETYVAASICVTYLT